MKKPDGQSLFLGASLLVALVAIGGLVLKSVGSDRRAELVQRNQSQLDWTKVPFQPDRSYEYLQQICRLGPRYSGSAGMQQQQELLHRHFTQLGGQVRRQTFRVRHPLDGTPVEMANLIVQWHPERTRRILLSAHYDTRPFPDQEPNSTDRRGEFVGANDGASGVAVLMELAHLMPKLDGPIGVDFVLFDGEELVFDDDRDEYFLGSRYFAEDYVRQPPSHRYEAAVLLDMVGDKHLQLYQERHGLSWPDTRPIVEEIWRTARDLGVKEFIPRRRYDIRDDHLMLHDVGGIPACDIIDFDYTDPASGRSYWHTRGDTPDKCSAASLGKVGYVVWEWLRRSQ